MPVLTGDILMHLSVNAGSSGGAMAGSTVTSGVTNNVWPDVSDGDRIAGGDLYRKTFWANENEIDALLLPVVYCPVLPTSMELSIGLGFDSSSDANPLQGNMTAFSAAALVEVVSDGADTRDVTIWGVDNAGDPVTEELTLNGDTPVLGATTFATVYAMVADGTSGSRTIEIRQGSGGTLRGSIPPNELCCWLWIVEPDAKGEGIALPDLGAGQSYGIWHRLSWLPDASPVRPNSLTTRIEEA